MRLRIVLLAAGSALLAVVLLSIPLGLLMSQNFLRDERLELQQAATTAAAHRGDLTESDVQGAVGREIGVSVYDASGRLTSGSATAAGAQLARASIGGSASSATDSGELFVAAPVSDGDSVVAVLILRTSLDSVSQRTHRGWLGLAGMDLLAVTIAAITARLVAGRLTAPIDRLTAVATRVGGGDLTARAASSGVRELDIFAETLNDTLERVRTQVEKERAFSTEVSHQLRTPLSALRLQIDRAHAGLLARKGRSVSSTEPTQDTAQLLASALEHVDRLETTIAEVISLARDLPDVGRTTLASALSGVEERWHGALATQARPLRVRSSVESDATLLMSQASVAQILDVLLGNAFVHGSGAVTVRARKDANLIAIEVEDEGPPLTAEAYTLFARSSRSDSAGTHGIGLAYARKLAVAEGARLVLGRSEPPTFTLVMPAATSTPTSSQLSTKPA